MSDTTNNWPGKPGVPLNPERDGWHWLQAHPDNVRATMREKFPAQWTAGNRHWIHGTYAPEYAAENWTYLGPCLTPDKATALQKRVAELKAENAALRNSKTEEEALRRMMRDPRYWRHRDPEWVNKVRDGFRKLTGGKDE